MKRVPLEDWKKGVEPEEASAPDLTALNAEQGNAPEPPKERERVTYQRLDDVRHLVGQYREFWKAEKRADPGARRKDILAGFNLSVTPETFNPFPNQLANWERKWAGELQEEREVPQVPESEAAPLTVLDEKQLVPGATLEAGAKSLAHILLADAAKMMEEDEDNYTAETAIKRKDHVLKVVAHVWKLNQKDQELELRKSADKRETAGFLMDIMRKATAGKLTEDEVDLMRTSFPAVRDDADASD